MSLVWLLIPFVVTLFLLSQLLAEVNTVNVTIDFDTVIGTNKLHTTLQAIVLPLLLRSSPIHDAVYTSLQNLNSDFVRLLFFSAYPALAVPQIEPPSAAYYCKHLNGNDNDNNWELSVECPWSPSAIIDDISFASFGSPTGVCGDFSVGKCNCNNTLQIVRDLCHGKHECTIPVNNQTFDLSGDANNAYYCQNVTYKSFSVQLRCNDSSQYQNSNWDFVAYMDEVMEDFYAAINPNRLANKSIVDFGVYPNWKYQDVAYGAGYIDNPYQASNDYSSTGDTLIDESGAAVGAYYGRLVSYYYNGQFVDEYNQTIVNHGDNGNGLKTYPIEILEVLNDPDIEHGMTPHKYTVLYDAIVTGILKFTQEMTPQQSQSQSAQLPLQFMGLSLKNYQSSEYFSYFLNKSNHVSADIPMDYISFNFFAVCNSEVNCVQQQPNTYTSFFTQADQFIRAVNENITKTRDALAPDTKIDIDEIGIALSDNEATQIPAVFWNAANAMYAYIYGALQRMQTIDIIGQSFLVGFADGTAFPGSPDLIQGFGASITMVNWTTGAPNAKYWGLKMMTDQLAIGDALVQTTVIATAAGIDANANASEDVLFAQGYTSSDATVLRILFVNKANQNITVWVNDRGGTKAKSGEIYIVDEMTGEGPARKQAFVASDPVVLHPFAVAVAVINA